MQRWVYIVLGIVIVLVLGIVSGVRFLMHSKKAVTVEQTTHEVTGLPITKVQDTATPGLTISYEYPTSGPGATIVENRIKDIVSGWKEENDTSKLTDEERDMYGLTDGRTYELTITYSNSENTAFSTHILTIYSFTGGAHGITTTETISVKPSGIKIMLTDMFTDKESGIQKLRNLLQQKLHSDFSDRLYSEETMVNDGLSDDALSEIPFEATPQGISFIFGQYQVGPYSSGIITVPLTSGELAGVINSEFLP